MARKGSNIYKRKDGRWEGRYKDPKSGKICSVYGKSYNETREKVLEKQKQAEDENDKCPLTVKKLFELWLNSIKVKIKPQSYSNYLSKLELHIYPIIGFKNYDALSGKGINDFIQNMLNNGRIGGGFLSPKYVSDIVMLLKSLGKFVQNEFNYRNIMLNINTPKIKQKELVILSRDEQNILKNYLIENISNKNIGVLLCLFTGIRLGELSALKWSDINLNERYIKISKTVQRTKNHDGETSTKIIITSPKSEKSNRTIPLPDFICAILKKHKKDDNCYVLSGTTKLVEPRLMQYHFKMILIKAFLPSVNFHSIRHMFTTNCLQCGFDVKTLSEILGHSSVQFTLNRYAHSPDERKRECMERLKLIS